MQKRRLLSQAGALHTWLFPSALLLLGLLAIIKPSAIASAPLFIIGWALVRVPVNSFEFHSCERTPQVEYLLRLLRHRRTVSPDT